MVVIEIEEKKYTITEMSYGDILDLKDDSTVLVEMEKYDKDGIPETVERDKFKMGLFVKNMIIKFVKDENGEAVEVHNKDKFPINHMIQLEKHLVGLYDDLKVKNK